MISHLSDQFYHSPHITYLNHASYGTPTRQMMCRVEHMRESLESDTALSLGPLLYEGLSQSVASIKELFGITCGATAIVPNATSAASALATSLMRSKPVRVVMLDLEYSSVIGAWRSRVADIGGHLDVIRVPLPIEHSDVLVQCLDSIGGDIDVFVFSTVTSSSSLALPMVKLSEWARKRGAYVLMDATHAGIQSPLNISKVDVDAVFGSLHKWLPLPRSVGYLWVADSLVDQVRPSEVSLNWNDLSFIRRFGWPGTWDPASALCVSDAVKVWRQWVQDREITRAEKLADLALQELGELGFECTGPEDMRPPLMRAFVLPRFKSEILKEMFLSIGIRAWIGNEKGATLLRLATHVYTSEDDIQLVSNTLKGMLNGA